MSQLPYVKGLPEGGVQDYHRGIMELNPFIEDMDAQQAEAVRGVAADPAHIELCFPTVHDPSLAPQGKHVITIDVKLPAVRAPRPELGRHKEDRADRVVATIAEYFPKLPDLIEHRQVVTPLDMERLMALTGGRALHGDMAPDQLLFLRPARGWADYERRSAGSTCVERARIREEVSRERTGGTGARGAERRTESAEIGGQP